MHMWDYYLAYCEGAFHERYISDVQLVLSKVTRGTQLLNGLAIESAMPV